ncbi:MAG TPA: TolC family protein [Anaeromyxobacteraceae bacterium]|nr:TolC family protein [Anaeromyxobacteraceae bacterium]
MRPSLRLLAALGAAVAARGAWAGPPVLPADPTLEALVRETLERRPELLQARAAVKAESQRVPQAGALPDPMLTLGIQNDGFQGIQVGKMESSFYQAMVTQPFFWPGKRGLRSEVASRDVQLAEARLQRAGLTAEADVRRAYVDLLLVRDQLALLEKQEALWEQSEGLARARYQVGQGPQSDLLRAQLERTRLRQRRLGLAAAERTRVQALNRLRAHPLDEPIETPLHLADVPDPRLPALPEALADAESRSPELREARLSVEQAEKRVELANRERYPDMAVSAGVMPRGSMDPMWTLSFSVGLPVYGGRKQGRAVAESEARRDAEGQGAEAIRQILRLRTEERLALLESELGTSALYRGGLLVQSEGTTESTMSQYRVGRVTFASVLEALNGYVADHASFLESMARAQRVAIAQWELSLEPPVGASAAMAGGAVPGAGTMGAGPARAGMGGGDGGAEPAAPSPSRGSGM